MQRPVVINIPITRMSNKMSIDTIKSINQSIKKKRIAKIEKITKSKKIQKPRTAKNPIIDDIFIERVFNKNIVDYANVMTPQDTTNNSTNNSISFDVISSTDGNTKYTVKINSLNGIEFECNCGDKWNIIPRRNNCKHIGCLIANIIKKYVNNSKSNKNTQISVSSNDDDVSDILDKLKDFFF